MGTIEWKTFDHRTRVGGCSMIVKTVDGESIGSVKRVNPEGGWLEMYVMFPRGIAKHRVVVDRKRKELVTVKVHCDYDVFERGTERHLYRVRWSKTMRKPVLTCEILPVTA